MIDEMPFLALGKPKRWQEAGTQKLLFDAILGMLTKYPLKPVLRPLTSLSIGATRIDLI
jgi:hypothetical protein